MLVTNWGRAKLVHYAQRLGLDEWLRRMASWGSRYVPLLSSINADSDTLGVQMHALNANKNSSRRKLHIKDASETEKLIGNGS